MNNRASQLTVARLDIERRHIDATKAAEAFAKHPNRAMEKPTEAELLVLIREFNHLAPDLAQLLDGWHCDVAWSEWDTSVRQRLSALQQKTDPLTR